MKYLKKPEKGDHEAQYNLGIMYQNGYGGIKIIKKQSIGMKSIRERFYYGT